MKVEIISVHNQGDYEEEYVMLKVKQKCDIGHYILADSTYTSDGKVSNKVRHTYWFPDKNVNKGDLISVWTKSGENKKTTSKSGKPLHRFYWGLESAVWNDEGDCAILFELNTWQFHKVSD